jgi:hypothetical protein
VLAAHQVVEGEAASQAEIAVVAQVANVAVLHNSAVYLTVRIYCLVAVGYYLGRIAVVGVVRRDPIGRGCMLYVVIV